MTELWRIPQDGSDGEHSRDLDEKTEALLQQLFAAGAGLGYNILVPDTGENGGVPWIVFVADEYGEMIRDALNASVQVEATIAALKAEGEQRG